MGLSDLPVARAGEVAKTLGRFGWTEAPGRGKGSHLVLVKKGHRPITLPTSGDSVKRALLGGVLKHAGISIDDFVAEHKSKGKKRR